MNSLLSSCTYEDGWLSTASATWRSWTTSPTNQRRWRNFKANRRGFWSLMVLLAGFFVSLFAEFIANDRPIWCTTRVSFCSPCRSITQNQKFGGFYAVTDYRDPSISGEIEKNGWIIWPPIRYSYNTRNMDYPGRKGPDGVCLGIPRPRLGPRARRSAMRRLSRSRGIRRSATAIGSGSTTRAATSLRASFTGSGCRCCSASY